MKLGIALIIMGAFIFGNNILFFTEPPLLASIFRTIVLPAGLITWGVFRVKAVRNGYKIH